MSDKVITTMNTVPKPREPFVNRADLIVVAPPVKSNGYEFNESDSTAIVSQLDDIQQLKDYLNSLPYPGFLQMVVTKAIELNLHYIPEDDGAVL